MTPPIVPSHRPRIQLGGPLQAALLRYGIGQAPAVRIVGIRGYYRDTLGVVGENDVGLYDDAIALVTPTTYATFNANVDPSRLHDGVAQLVAGAVYWYKLGIHGLSRPQEQRYKALIQAAPVKVRRHNGPVETGFFGINIHRGGHHTTGSEGCQTVHPSQWVPFLSLLELELGRAAQPTVPYLLLDAEELQHLTPDPGVTA